jgi:hypothetical protein
MIPFGSFEAVRFRGKGRPLQRATLVYLPLGYLHLAFRQIRGFAVRAVMVASSTKKLNGNVPLDVEKREASVAG